MVGTPIVCSDSSLPHPGLGQVISLHHAPNLTVCGNCSHGKLEAMRVVVCVKHVPDGASDRRIEDRRIVRGEDDVLNELDEFAIETAVSTVESVGGEVIAVSIGPDDAEDAVLRALQMGADRGILVSDLGLEGSDVPATAAVLAAAIGLLSESEPIDLVVTGMASLDGMTSMLPAALSATLEWPLLDLACEFSVNPDSVSFTVRRDLDGWEDIISAPAPAVISVTDQINEPRYPSFKTMRAARSKPLEHLELADLQPFFVGQVPAETGSATMVVEASEIVREAGVIVTDSGDGGLKLAEYLRSVEEEA